MNGFTINMRTFTHAQKAQSYLTRKGIMCRVERSFGQGRGCGFLLRVTGARNGSTDKEEICSMLQEIGVNCDIS